MTGLWLALAGVLMIVGVALLLRRLGRRGAVASAPPKPREESDVTLLSKRHLLEDAPGEPKGRVTTLSKRWLLPEDEQKK